MPLFRAIVLVALAIAVCAVSLFAFARSKDLLVPPVMPEIDSRGPASPPGATSNPVTAGHNVAIQLVPRA
jgi:hypothetical protein